MIRASGRYRQQTVELDVPLDLSDGTAVEVVVQVKAESPTAERDEIAELGMSRLEQEWDNPEDAVYDDWKKLYGL